MSSQDVLLLKNRSVPEDKYQRKFASSSQYRPQFIPLLSHESYNKQATIAYLNSENFANIGVFVITSQRGVEILAECLQEITDEEIQQTIFNKIAYTVGPATYEQLKDIGFKNVRGGNNAGNGQILSELMIAELVDDEELQDRRIVTFFTGEIHRDIIPNNLISAGFEVDKKIIYSTKVRDDVLDNFTSFVTDNTENGWVVLFSPQGTEHIVKYIQTNKVRFKIAVIGPTTETYLNNHGIIPTVVSPKPDAESLYSIISNYDRFN
ncbi:tetrapyrrole biosynthesis, uroporphyrinogen III synthase [Scheffersomyces amazonensis]|uniref:tetrapyrrole biosynthesis, uroporphyrinogen III synthase n=1 Tax=Scheffersomyces amazonensis TaxID=1078765 RepID=UPI00315CC262